MWKENGKEIKLIKKLNKNFFKKKWFVKVNGSWEVYKKSVSTPVGDEIIKKTTHTKSESRKWIKKISFYDLVQKQSEVSSRKTFQKKFLV